MKKCIFWFLTIFLMSSSMIFAQSTITGKVTDNSNNPITNAIVEVKGNSNSVKTSNDGSFKITSKENNGILLISSLGFESFQVSFSGNFIYLLLINLFFLGYMIIIAGSPPPPINLSEIKI